jgi:hypothetical protein
MATIIEIITAIAPEHASNASIDIFITIAEGLTSACVFGDNYNFAVALRAAHLMTLAGRNGDSGQISSKSEGGQSISYSSSTVGIDNLNQTSYGKQLQELIYQNVPGFSIANVTTKIGCDDET